MTSMIHRFGPHRLLTSFMLLCCLLLQAPAALADSDPLAEEQAPFRYQLLSNDYRFTEDGQSLQVTEAEIEILKPEAIQLLGQLHFPFSGDLVKLEVDYARIIKPDGSQVEASTELFKELAAPVAMSFPVYSDQRVLHVTVPAFEVGDQLHYRIRQTFEYRKLLEHLSVLHRFQRWPVVESEILRIDLPASENVSYRAAEGLEPAIETTEDRRVYSWTVSSAELNPEDEDQQLTSDIELSAAPSWRAIGEWYRSMSEGRAEPSDKIRSLAREQLEGIDEPRAQIEALHRYVTTKIRYLGLLLGSTRFQPRFADHVLESGYGDCKDKHTLLSALLDAAGFESSGLLVGVTREVPLDVPTALHFDHIMTYLELDGEPIWLDSTAIAPPGFMAKTIRGEQGLLVPPTGEPRLIDLPEQPEQRDAFVLESRATVETDGTLVAKTTASIHGDAAVQMRSLKLSVPPEMWQQSIEYFATGLHRKAEHSDLRTSDAMAIEKPFEVSFTSTRSAFLTGSGEVELDVPLPRFELPRELPETDDDELDLESLHRTEYRLRLELPMAQSVTPPAPVTLDYENFSYRAEASLEEAPSGVVLVIEKSMHAKVLTLDKAKVNEYNAFRRAVKKEQERSIPVRLDAAIGTDIAAITDFDELRKRAKKASEKKDWTEAETISRRLTELRPDEPKAWDLLARTLRKLDKDNEALDARRRVTELDRFYADAFYNLGLAHWDVEDEPAAIEAFREQLAIDPFHGRSRASLGRLLGKAGGDCKEIEPLLRGHDASTFAYDWILAYLGLCQQELGLADEAAETLETLRTRSHAEAIEHAAFALTHLELADESIPLLQKLTELEPEHETVHASLGWAFFQSGQTDEAEKAFRRQLEINPSDGYSVWALVQQLSAAQRVADAVTIIEEYDEASPDDPQINYVLGLLYYQQNQPKLSRGRLEKVDEQFVKDFDVNRVLGLIAANDGRYADAKRYLEVAKAVNGERFEDQDMLDYIEGELTKNQ